jgi:hypothetical protein
MVNFGGKTARQLLFCNPFRMVNSPSLIKTYAAVIGPGLRWAGEMLYA